MKQKKITREEIPSMEEKSLSSKETGRIGGLMTRRRRKSAEDPA